MDHDRETITPTRGMEEICEAWWREKLDSGIMFQTEAYATQESWPHYVRLENLHKNFKDYCETNTITHSKFRTIQQFWKTLKKKWMPPRDDNYGGYRPRTNGDSEIRHCLYPISSLVECKEYFAAKNLRLRVLDARMRLKHVEIEKSPTGQQSPPKLHLPHYRDRYLTLWWKDAVSRRCIPQIERFESDSKWPDYIQLEVLFDSYVDYWKERNPNYSVAVPNKQSLWWFMKKGLLPGLPDGYDVYRPRGDSRHRKSLYPLPTWDSCSVYIVSKQVEQYDIKQTRTQEDSSETALTPKKRNKPEPWICDDSDCTNPALLGSNKCLEHKKEDEIEELILPVPKEARMEISLQLKPKTPGQEPPRKSPSSCEHPESILRAFYGVDKRVRCTNHKLDTDKRVEKHRCVYEGCEDKAVYGIKHKESIHCSKHRGIYEKNVYSGHPCNSCGINLVPYSRKICFNCNLVGVKTSKEYEVVQFLLSCGSPLDGFMYNKKVAQSCGSRPDISYLASSHHIANNIVIEVDENQHRDYDPRLEHERMMGIAKSLENPTVFIRYNPDAARDEETRLMHLTTLKETIKQYWIIVKMEHYVHVRYLFYDQVVELE